MANKKISEVKLIDLLPSNLSKDPDIQAAAESIDEGFFAVVNETNNLLILPRIDELGHDMLDHLAYFLRTPYYDVSYMIDRKRGLIKNSIYANMLKGTPEAVDTIIDIVFGDGYIEEWFEYGGNPYMFKVYTLNTAVIDERKEEFRNMLESIKNVRSHLERIEFIATSFFSDNDHFTFARSHFQETEHRWVYPT